MYGNLIPKPQVVIKESKKNISKNISPPHQISLGQTQV